MKKLESVNLEKFKVNEKELSAVQGGTSGTGSTTTTLTKSTIQDSGFEDTQTTSTTCDCDPCPTPPPSR